MTDEVRAAAERLRKAYGPGHWKDSYASAGFRTEPMQIDQFACDKKVVIAAYLAEHPADDPCKMSRLELLEKLKECKQRKFQLTIEQMDTALDDAEPITAEWLESVGASVDLDIEHPTAPPVTGGISSDSHGQFWIDLFQGESEVQWMLYTRRDVRLLCRALGIELEK